MGRSKKFDYQAIIENSLIAYPEGLTLDEVLERSGLDVDRSTLFRHLTQLIEQGRAERVGKARASRYRPLNQPGITVELLPSDAQRPGVSREPAVTERRAQVETPFPPRIDVHQMRQTSHAEPVSIPATAPEHVAVIRKAVRTIVRDWKRFDRVNLQIYLSLMVKRERLDVLAAAVEEALAGLDEDNLDDYGLTPEEFHAFVPAEIH